MKLVGFQVYFTGKDVVYLEAITSIVTFEYVLRAKPSRYMKRKKRSVYYTMQGMTFIKKGKGKGKKNMYAVLDAA